MDYVAACEYLDSLINYETKPRAGRIEGLSVDTMQKLMWSIGDPHRAYPVVHVTGTNGKGSTVRMTARILHAMGLRVGAYTSPHVVEPTERIEVNSAPISPVDFGAAVGEVAQISDFLGIRTTWFETVTAAALAHFASVAVDAAVVEVGMLGRFDATNVVEGSVAVLTNVGLDHTDGQGDWRCAVAHEKAGIVKPSSVIVCGDTDAMVSDMFQAEQHVSIVVRDRDFGVVRDRLAVGGRLMDIYTPRARYDELLVALHGRHQADNASLAVTAAEAFFDAALPEDAVVEALADTTVPGRFEIVGRRPLVVLDGAHNPDGARAVVATLRSDFSPSGNCILVIGMQTGRDFVGVLDAFSVGGGTSVVACTAPTARGVPAADLAAAARMLGAEADAREDVGDALQRALECAGPDDIVLVSGSFTVVGAVREQLAAKARMSGR